ncbi:Uncharacterized protein OBRU01_01304 [Operophtera brumata]|uniref:Ketosynthase family 3 (KS3) domain-containing protein n=1 Tax=Operophtera brumata TaxID=104452 RepID=A0A0L7LTQ0_OPEBR|nr:Uncharacterized protein OBRU01_01304 [Operophtera brumata]
MFANRVSYWLNAKGPSHSIDAACCSSTVALEQAYQAMTRGECEAAIVGGTNLCLHPQSSVHFGRIMNLSKDGKSKSFDLEASGCAKSEAINVLFLQRAKDTLRIYADLVDVKCEFIKIPNGETGPKYGFYRDPEDTARFLKGFYDRAGVSPSVVEYVEGFGSAVLEADKSELDAFDKIFCNNRDEPLMVGSVMSNIGYGEAASGISAITKVLLGYHRGELAGNLNCETPRNDVAAIKEGRIQVLNEHQQFRRTYAAVNSLSVTGVNAHVLLHGHYKPKNINRYKSNIPHLITISGRQDSSVTRALDELKSRPIDPEQLALLQNIHQTRINGHLGRGYAVLDTKDGKTISLSEQVNYFDDVKRPLWFVYSGMGSQWPGMGKQLMRMPIFAAAIERCRQVLEPKGIDIVQIITSTDKTIFDNILHSFVGIAAVQIGHSVGELGCAYADGCLSAEEMILSAYSRGLVSLETTFIRGSMAAIGLGFYEVSKMCPPEIEIACHNSADSCTISGPADDMKTFISELVAKGIFAKEVPCSNIAYHSRYIANAGPGLLKYLKEIIKTPTARSDKWVSTSVPQDRWEEEAAKFSSAEYHTNNLLNPVLFEETSKLIPINAVLVEIAPHGLLQAILKRSLPESCTNIPLTRRGHTDSPRMVLEAVGQLYMEGYYPKVQVLYPKVEFPVSTGTPFLSYLVDWAHSEKWTVPLFVSADRMFAASCKFMVSVHDDEHNYLKGHVIRRKTQLPFSYALVAAWDTLAMTLKVPKKQLSVIMDGNMIVTTGFINSDDKPVLKSDVQHTEDDFELNSRDVYRLFYERDYAYSNTLTEANILWNDNWVTFIDGMLQLNALRHPHNAVSEPSQIRRMVIDVKKHLKYIITKDDTAIVKAHVSVVSDLTRCGGVLIENLKFHDLPPSKEKQIDLKTLRFVPRFQSNSDIFTSLLIFTQIVVENINRNVVKIVGIAHESSHEDFALLEEMKRVVSAKIPGIRIEYTNVIKNTITQISSENIVKEADLVLAQNLSNDDQMARMLQRSSCNDVFLINEALNTTKDIKTDGTYRIVSVLTDTNNTKRLELVRYRPALPVASTTSVLVRSEKDLPSLIAARSKLSPQDSLIILSTYPPFSGLKSLVKHWRKDSTQNNINLMMVNEAKDTKHLSKLPGDLVYNILENGVWGGEYYLPLKENPANGSEIILRNEVIGNLQSLKWDQAPAPTKAGVSVMVHYAGVNMNDVLRASGVIPMKHEDSKFGMEFSGVTKSGERVMGLVSDGAAQSHVIVQPEFMWPVPSYWTLEDAATVPHVKTDIFSVLVHGGAGALGQAMISVCLAKGYRVFTTVSDLQKKKFLLRLFPKLKEEDIGSSRDASFADMVLSATGGKGCDIVICSLKGELKRISLKCSAKFGQTYDTVQTHNQEIFNFGMHFLDKERGYWLVDISTIFFKPEAGEGKLLQTLMSDGIASGAVRPLSRVTYALHEVSRAFNLLAASRHRGRVLLRFQNQQPPAQRRLICSGDQCHIIFCDEQPIGLQLADMLISSGAKKIHLHFTHPPSHLRYKQRLAR